MLAPRHRVTQGDDYRRIVRKGRRVGGAVCITHAVFSYPESPARFGFIISKAVGNAVTRNLVRRRMKSIANQLISEGMTGLDIVLRALPPAGSANYDAIKADMVRAALRLQDKQAEPASVQLSASP